MQSSNTEKVIALLKSFETGDATPQQYINPDKYIQHNLRAADGLAGFKTIISNLPPNCKVNIVRIVEDGDYVIVHSEYYFTSARIGFDIFRFEDGKIVEHWDNLQAKQPLNPSGHSMIDGETEINDLDKTSATKELSKRIVDDILVNGRFEKLAGYFDGDNYIQHNPWFPDQVSGLAGALTEWAKQGKTMKYDKIHNVLGKGNFALVVSEGKLDGVHSAFYDLFRVQNGKIAEHWDTIEEIPAVENHKNSNGKF